MKNKNCIKKANKQTNKLSTEREYRQLMYMYMCCVLSVVVPVSHKQKNRIYSERLAVEFFSLCSYTANPQHTLTSTPTPNQSTQIAMSDVVGGDAVIRIKPFHYIHVLDNNHNVTRYVVL
jgi:hypothetical protein